MTTSYCCRWSVGFSLRLKRVAKEIKPLATTLKSECPLLNILYLIIIDLVMS